MARRRKPLVMRYIMSQNGDYIGTHILGANTEYIYKVGGSTRDKGRVRKSRAPRIAILITIGILIVVTYFLVEYAWYFYELGKSIR